MSRHTLPGSGKPVLLDNFDAAVVFYNKGNNVAAVLFDQETVGAVFTVRIRLTQNGAVHSCPQSSVKRGCRLQKHGTGGDQKGADCNKEEKNAFFQIALYFSVVMNKKCPKDRGEVFFSVSKAKKPFSPKQVLQAAHPSFDWTFATLQI